MTKFEIEITSVPDRTKLVAEIWFENNLVAEINQESDFLELEIYTQKNKLVVPVADFLVAIEIAKNKLESVN